MFIFSNDPERTAPFMESDVSNALQCTAVLHIFISTYHIFTYNCNNANAGSFSNIFTYEYIQIRIISTD